MSSFCIRCTQWQQVTATQPTNSLQRIHTFVSFNKTKIRYNKWQKVYCSCSIFHTKKALKKPSNIHQSLLTESKLVYSDTSSYNGRKNGPTVSPQRSTNLCVRREGTKNGYKHQYRLHILD